MKEIHKIQHVSIKYFELFPLLNGLENERPGIRNRLWDWMCDEIDYAFKPHNNQIYNLNLFYFGVGDEYNLNYLKEYPEELERSKKIHPEAFKDGIEKEIRLDLNLILCVYQDVYFGDIGLFPVMPKW